jgi:hypothetical protein
MQRLAKADVATCWLQTAFPIGVFSILDRPFKDLKTYMRFPKVSMDAVYLTMSLDHLWTAAFQLSAVLPRLPM